MSYCNGTVPVSYLEGKEETTRMQTVSAKTLLENQLLKSVNRKVPPGDSISSWLRSTIVQPILSNKNRKIL
jgi:hypothetical protein